MLFNSVFTIFWDFNIQCRVCYTACSVNRRETVSLFKFPIKSLMIPFELNWPVSLITIYILYVIITRGINPFPLALPLGQNERTALTLMWTRKTKGKGVRQRIGIHPITQVKYVNPGSFLLRRYRYILLCFITFLQNRIAAVQNSNIRGLSLKVNALSCWKCALHQTQP